MEQDIIKKLDEQQLKIDAIYLSVEKSRKYFLVTMWVTLLAIILPILGIGILAPSMLNTYTTMINGTE
jgi:hypothetical protein